MTDTIEFDETDEETLMVSVNGAKVGTFDNDEHGYSTMADVRVLVVEIAKKLNLAVIEK